MYFWLFPLFVSLLFCLQLLFTAILEHSWKIRRQFATCKRRLFYFPHFGNCVLLLYCIWEINILHFARTQTLYIVSLKSEIWRTLLHIIWCYHSRCKNPGGFSMDISLSQCTFFSHWDMCGTVYIQSIIHSVSILPFSSVKVTGKVGKVCNICGWGCGIVRDNYSQIWPIKNHPLTKDAYLCTGWERHTNTRGTKASADQRICTKDLFCCDMAVLITALFLCMHI